MPKTERSEVTFHHPFTIDGSQEQHPAGKYQIETDYELLMDLNFPVYRRLKVLIHLHNKTNNPALGRTLIVEPRLMDDALRRDSLVDGENLKKEKAAAQAVLDRENMI